MKTFAAALLFAAVNAGVCTKADCCVPSNDCAPGQICPTVCAININCVGNIFDICQEGGPTVSLPEATGITEIDLPPKPTETQTAFGAEVTAVGQGVESVAVTTLKAKKYKATPKSYVTITTGIQVATTTTELAESVDTMEALETDAAEFVQEG